MCLYIYIYIHTFIDTIRFKVVMIMNLSELHSLVCFCENNTKMSDLLKSLVRES